MHASRHRPVLRLPQAVAKADHRERTMFTSIRKYNVRRGSAEELARLARFLPPANPPTAEHRKATADHATHTYRVKLAIMAGRPDPRGSWPISLRATTSEDRQRHTEGSGIGRRGKRHRAARFKREMVATMGRRRERRGDRWER